MDESDMKRLGEYAAVQRRYAPLLDEIETIYQGLLERGFPQHMAEAYANDRWQRYWNGFERRIASLEPPKPPQD